MSTVTAARQGSARVQSLRPALRLLAPPLTRRWRPSFVALCSLIMLGCLGALLGINILLTRGAYTEQQLTLQQTALTESEQSLSDEVAKAASPVQLGARARALGMIPNSSPAFIELSSGTIAGSPTPASLSTAPGAGELSGTTAGQTAEEQTAAAAEANSADTSASDPSGVPSVDPGQGVTGNSRAGTTSDGATPVQGASGATAGTQSASPSVAAGADGASPVTSGSAQQSSDAATPIGAGR